MLFIGYRLSFVIAAALAVVLLAPFPASAEPDWELAIRNRKSSDYQESSFGTFRADDQRAATPAASSADSDEAASLAQARHQGWSDSQLATIAVTLVSVLAGFGSIWFIAPLLRQSEAAEVNVLGRLVPRPE